MHKLPDETTPETEIRKRISQTCEELGLTAMAANEMADRAIINLRNAKGPLPEASANKKLVRADEQPPHQPRQADEDLVTKLLGRWQDTCSKKST